MRVDWTAWLDERMAALESMDEGIAEPEVGVVLELFPREDADAEKQAA